MILGKQKQKPRYKSKKGELIWSYIVLNARNHVYNPFFYEGTKTYIYEVYEQLHRIPANIVVPVGNGTLFLGVLHALEHLLESGCIERMPQIIALQTETCDPILRAAEQGQKEPAKITPQEKYGPTSDCLITMCGAGLKSDH